MDTLGIRTLDAVCMLPFLDLTGISGLQPLGLHPGSILPLICSVRAAR